MRILIATGIYPPDIGGPAIYSEKLAQALVERNHEVVVVTYSSRIKNHELRIKNDGFKVVIISRNWPLIFRYSLYSLKVFWYGIRVNLVYVQDPVSVGLPAAVANLILRKPFVLKVVGDYAWERSQLQILNFRFQALDEFLKQKPKDKIRLLWEIERWVAREAKLIITPSNYLKSMLMKWGVPEEKIKVIYNAVDTPSILPLGEGEDGGGGGRMTIISAGRLVPWKGFDTLIEVVAEIIKEKPDVELVIYGDGPEGKNLEFRIKNYGLENNVKLAGRVLHEELLRVLQEQATIFVLNSSYEGMSHQILEAQALGIPVAVSRVGGNPEIVQDGETGLLFEYNNKEQIKGAILRLLNDKQLIDTMRDKARRQIVERHDFNKMIDSTINILRGALAPRA